jgi:hypothetical protein
MKVNDPNGTEKSQEKPRHTPGQTEGNRKGLDDRHASQSKPKVPMSESPDASESVPVPRFDEGGRGPTHLEGSDAGGLRVPAPVVSADPKKYVKPDDAKTHVEATMPPGEGTDPKRNTM